MNPLLIDTHVWLWWENGTPGRISPEARKEIAAGEAGLGLWIASMSMWEVAMLVSRRRIEVEPDALTWMQRSLAQRTRSLVPLTPEIAVVSNHLPDAPVGDPVDRILLATARVENMTLVTADRKLIDYGRKHYLKVLAL